MNTGFENFQTANNCHSHTYNDLYPSHVFVLNQHNLYEGIKQLVLQTNMTLTGRHMLEKTKQFNGFPHPCSHNAFRFWQHVRTVVGRQL